MRRKSEQGKEERHRQQQGRQTERSVAPAPAVQAASPGGFAGRRSGHDMAFLLASRIRPSGIVASTVQRPSDLARSSGTGKPNLLDSSDGPRTSDRDKNKPPENWPNSVCRLAGFAACGPPSPRLTARQHPHPLGRRTGPTWNARCRKPKHGRSADCSPGPPTISTARSGRRARLDAEVLLANAAGCQRIELYTRFEEPADDDLRTRFRDLVRRRSEGMPVAYLVGRREFYSLPFRVTPDVLIPRPRPNSWSLRCSTVSASCAAAGPFRVADVGTGSGIIAICTAKYAPQAADHGDR